MFKNNFFLIFVNKKTDLVRQNVLKFLYEYCYNITVDPKLNELCIQGSTLVPNTADRGSDVGQMFPKLMTRGTLSVLYSLYYAGICHSVKMIDSRRGFSRHFSLYCTALLCWQEAKKSARENLMNLITKMLTAVYPEVKFNC